MTTPEARIQEVFEAWEAACGEGREPDLTGLCGGDAALEGAVRRRIAVFEAIEPALGVHGEESKEQVGLEWRGAPAAGAVIGKYRLLRKLGEGGFGVVFEAERTGGFQERVAVKVLRRGVGTKAGRARFASEGQALALVRHPNIASVLDAGVSDDGVPYLAMDLIDGEPLNGYCDSHGLGLSERLELMLAVCDAVGHAHTKGVIHRDLKPANVLVTRVDARAVPKVIDFGIARITTPISEDEARITQVGELIGTAAYMSPEQLGVLEEDADTRADIYSLGVMLYEMLSGSLPYSKTDEVRLDRSELQRRMQQWEPISLMSRARTGKFHRVSGGVHSSAPLSVPRELNWLVMKCLEVDPDRRYETCRELAGDIRRYQQGEPLIAGPRNTSYLVKKFVQRNRTLVVATLTVVLSIVLGLAGTLIGLLDAQEARGRAELSALEARDQAAAARYEHYITGLQAASASLHASDPVAARRSLDSIPKEFRAWEYEYLKYRIDSSSHAHEFAGQMYSVGFGQTTGSLYAVGGDGLLVRLSETGERIVKSAELPSQAHSLAISPSGRWLALGDTEGRVMLADAESLEIALSVQLSRQPIVRMTFLDAYTLLASSRDGTVRAMTVESEASDRLVERWSREFPAPVFALARMDGMLWAGDQNGTITIMDPSDGRVIGARSVSERRIHDIEPIPGTKQAIVATLDGELILVGSARGREGAGITIEKVVSTGIPIAELALLADGSAVLAATHAGGISMFTVPALLPLEKRFGHEGRVYSVAAHPGSPRWASASIDHTVRIWESSLNAPRTVSGRPALQGIGGRSDFPDFAIGVAPPFPSAETGTPSTHASEFPPGQWDFLAQNDQAYIALARSGGRATVVDKYDESSRDLESWPQRFQAVSISNESSTIAVLDDQGIVNFGSLKRDPEGLKPILAWGAGDHAFISCVANAAVVLGRDGVGELWDEGVKRPVRLDIGDATVEQIALAPCRTRLAVGVRWGKSEGVVLRVCDIESGRMLMTIDSNLQGVRSMWFSTSGRQLVAYTRAGEVYRYSGGP